jgi:nicotinamide mononucleotide (NMN) deamidase PncC
VLQSPAVWRMIVARRNRGWEMLQDLLPRGERIAARLKAKGETMAIAESATAGLVSAALLAIPGASAYFIGVGVVYTRQSRTELLGVTEAEIAGITPSDRV